MLFKVHNLAKPFYEVTKAIYKFNKYSERSITNYQAQVPYTSQRNYLKDLSHIPNFGSNGLVEQPFFLTFFEL